MSTERRRSFRCKTDPELNREEGTLHTRRGDVTVRLDNRSSGGFGVFLPEGSNSHVNNDEEIAFSLASGSSLVRVAHQSKTPEGVVIGLEFLRELPSHMSKNYVQRRGKGGGPWGIIPLCALAGCLLLTAVNFTWSRSLVGASVASLVGLAAQPESPQVVTAAASHSQQETLQQAQRQARELQLAHSFVHIDQLRSHRAIGHLDLTLHQQQDIGRIVKETSFAMEAIYRQRDAMSDQEWTELGLQLLQASAKRIESTLSDRQRAQWSNMLVHEQGERVN